MRMFTAGGAFRPLGRPPFKTVYLTEIDSSEPGLCVSRGPSFNEPASEIGC